jgi:GNAT superfamily N-acetyltransferase
MYVRQSGAEDSAGILNLLERSMGWGTDPRFRRFFAWKHVANPFGVSPMWVAEEDGRIIGLRAWLRWRLTDGARTLTAVRAVDTATERAHRGQGVFRRLTEDSLAALEADGVDLVFNTPNSASGTGYRTMGWQDVGRLPIAVRFGSVVGAVDALRPRRAADRWSMPCAVGVDARKANAGGDLVEQYGLPASEGRLVTPLDSGFLAWRYGFKDLHYRALTVGGALGFFRVRRRGRATECVIGHVLGTDDRARCRLIVRIAAEVGADRTLVLDGGVGAAHGFVRPPQVGPHLMARAISDARVPSLRGWGLTMGDVELF